MFEMRMAVRDACKASWNMISYTDSHQRCNGNFFPFKEFVRLNRPPTTKGLKKIPNRLAHCRTHPAGL